MKIQTLLLLSFLWVAQNVYAQTYEPNLHDKKQLSASGRSLDIDVKGSKGIKIGAGNGHRVTMVNNIVFKNGTIEFDCKGRNLMNSSFLGLAFHAQNDSTYDAIYFRPFNFSNPDTVRRWRAVQYIAIPGNEWDKLRAAYPGKYENKVNPVPDGDGWFHCRITVKDKLVSVFVNNSPKPSLVVTKLTNTTSGKIGFWVESGSEGSFADLKITSE